MIYLITGLLLLIVLLIIRFLSKKVDKINTKIKNKNYNCECVEPYEQCEQCIK